MQLIYNILVVQNPHTDVFLPAHKTTSLPTSNVQTKKIPQAPLPADIDPHLNKEYNFDTFIEGESNKLSRSVAEAVALNPSKTIFNPCSSMVLRRGKTHLVNAIGTKIKELYPEKFVLYVSAHLFQVQYTDSVRNNTFTTSSLSTRK